MSDSQKPEALVELEKLLQSLAHSSSSSGQSIPTLSQSKVAVAQKIFLKQPHLYKLLVHELERFMAKVNPAKLKILGLYLTDAVCKAIEKQISEQANRKSGSSSHYQYLEKLKTRFEQKLPEFFGALHRAELPDDVRSKITKLLAVWHKAELFPKSLLQDIIAKKYPEFSFDTDTIENAEEKVQSLISAISNSKPGNSNTKSDRVGGLKDPLAFDYDEEEQLSPNELISPMDNQISDVSPKADENDQNYIQQQQQIQSLLAATQSAMLQQGSQQNSSQNGSQDLLAGIDIQGIMGSLATINHSSATSSSDSSVHKGTKRYASHDISPQNKTSKFS